MREVVDLHDDAVDLVGERVALVLPGAAVLVDGFERVEGADLGVHRQAEVAEHVEGLVVARELGAAFDLTELVAPDRELARRGDLRVLLTQRAGRRVARVREEPIAGLGLTLVQGVEGGDRHVHLAPHLEHLRCSFEAVGKRLDRLHVRGHVLARAAVTTGRGLHEPSAFVAHRHREAVDLELADEAHRAGAGRGQAALRARAPGDELVERERVVERHHRHAVGDRSEGRRRRAAHELGGRVRRHDLGELVLEPAQLAHQRVVVRVADLGIVERVIALVVVPDLVSKRVDPGGDLVGDGHAPRLSRGVPCDLSREPSR